MKLCLQLWCLLLGQTATEKQALGRPSFTSQRPSRAAGGLGCWSSEHVHCPSGSLGVLENEVLDTASCELKLDALNIHQYPHLGTAGDGTRPPQVLGLRWYLRCYNVKLHTIFDVPKICQLLSRGAGWIQAAGWRWGRQYHTP